MRCSFLAAICIPGELLFTGAVARRSPSVPSFSFQARLSRLKTNKQLSYQPRFLLELLHSASGLSNVVLFLAGGTGF